MNNVEKRVDITVSLTETQYQRFKELSERCGMEHPKELWNAAMSFLYHAKNEVDNGRVIASYDEKDDTVVVLNMPALNKQ